MIIKDIHLQHTSTQAILSARCKIRKLGWDTVYFKIDAAKAAYIATDASPFAAALLIPSMRVGEDLIIKGSISEQLYTGMQAIMQELLTWDIGLKPIAIKVDTLAKDACRPTKTACFFSGGVDSFYTYLKHKQDKRVQDRVDTFILVNNSFDIDSRNGELWEANLKNLQTIAKEERIDLMVVESNINSHELLDPIVPWDYIHGACLAAVGLALRGAFRRVYIASTFSVEEQVPWGSHLKLDDHWSTETIRFIHDGTEATRYEKVRSQIAISPVALKYLRVCYINEKGTFNCGRCAKCLRTMISLYAADALDKSKTFPTKVPIELVARTPAAPNAGVQIFHGENQNLNALKQQDRAPELQAAILSSIQLTRDMQASKFKEPLERIAQKARFVDHRYARGHGYAVLSRTFGRKFS